MEADRWLPNLGGRYEQPNKFVEILKAYNETKSIVANKLSEGKGNG